MRHLRLLYFLLLSCLAPSLAALEIRKGTYEGRAHFIVQTDAAAYFYDRDGGGFSRLIDSDGLDWIAFRKDPLQKFPDSAAAGYRGLPNLVFGQDQPDAGAGHPGFDRCRTEQVNASTLRSVTRSGTWSWTWRFTETNATMTMDQADPDRAWWFLYEGPIAGTFHPESKFWGTDQGGPREETPHLRQQHFDQWRWIYFGDREVPRVLFLLQHEKDRLADTLWFLGSNKGGALTASDGMVVFGFGRGPGTRPLLRGSGHTFTLGLLEVPATLSDQPGRLHHSLARQIEAQLRTDSGSEAARNEASLAERLSRPGQPRPDQDHSLEPLFPPGAAPDLQGWKAQRKSRKQKWERLLGYPSFVGYSKRHDIIDRFEQPEFRGTLIRQTTGPDAHQTVLLMQPWKPGASPLPGAVVPYYHPDHSAGLDVSTRKPLTDKATTQFGRHLVQQGYIVICTEAFPYNTVPEPTDASGLNWWRAAAERLLQDHPNWTGMGKLVHDTRRAIDLLLLQPDIDPERIVLIGHSLGGKMAFYTGCLDERVRVTVASDFGIGWDFTNWSDPWYLGEQILAEDFSLAHHELLALHAPRPFLLIAGEYDGLKSWDYLEEARKAYLLYGAEQALGMLHHAQGHQPPREAMRLAYRWLAEVLPASPRSTPEKQ